MAATPSSDFWIGLRYLHSGQLSWIDGRARKYLNLNRRVGEHSLNCVL